MRGMPLFHHALASLLAASTMAVSAQERMTTTQTDTFVGHPTYCAQLIGEDDQLWEIAPNQMIESFLAAMVSLKHLSSVQVQDQISSMCREKMSRQAQAPQNTVDVSLKKL